MQPRIDFHDVASIELSPIRTYNKGEPTEFSARSITLTDGGGKKYSMCVFADVASRLVPVDREEVARG